MPSGQRGVGNVESGINGLVAGSGQRAVGNGESAAGSGEAGTLSPWTIPGGRTSPRAILQGRSAGVLPSQDHASPSSGSAAAGRVVLVRQHPRAVPLPEAEERHAIRLPAGGTIWITDDGSDLSRALCRCLQERGYGAQVIPPGGLSAPALDEILSGLIILAPRQPRDEFVSQAFRTLRAAGPALERSARIGGASLLTVSRLDGRFGMLGLAAGIDPAAGALAGLAKTAGCEWIGVHCKAVDLDTAIDGADVAAGMIVQELLERGPGEVGLTARERLGLELVPVPMAKQREPSDGADRRRRAI